MKALGIHSRMKLRRSRSACDISEMRNNLKRTGMSTLPPIPTKFARIAHNTKPAATASSSFAATSAAGRVARSGSVPAKRPMTTALTSTTSGTVRPLPRTASAATVNKAKPASTSSATTAATKRIAPYDFKARFHDLLEKHKALKTKYEKQVEDMGELESLPTQLEETQNKLIETESNLKNVTTNNECLERQVKQQTNKIETITGSLGRTVDELNKLKASHQVNQIINYALCFVLFEVIL